MRVAGMVIRTAIYVLLFAGFSRLLARMWASVPEQSRAGRVLRPGRLIQGLGALEIVLAVVAASLMYVTFPVIRMSLTGTFWLVGGAETVCCGRTRHVAWSRVTRVRCLWSGGLRLETHGENSVTVGMGLVGFSSFIKAIEGNLDASKWAEALSKLRRQYPAA